MSVGRRRMVSLDCRRDAAGKAPSPDQDGADQGMVDPQLSTLVAHPLLGRDQPVVQLIELLVHLRHHQATHIVKQSGNGQLVWLLEARQLGDPVGRMAGGHGVSTEALVAACRAVWRLERIVSLD